MSQKQTLNTIALAAVLAMAVFVVAFALMVFLADYTVMGSLFMGLLVALGAGIVLLIGFGTPETATPAPVARVAPQATPEPAAPPVAPAPAEDSDAREAAAEAAAPVAEESTPDYDGDGVREGAEEGTRPAGLEAPRGGEADDLKQIKGIGPKLEKLCNRLGFWHFDQVAAWTSDEVAWVDANLEGFKGRVTRDNWVDQAKVLAAGGETEFSKRVEDGDVY